MAEGPIRRACNRCHTQKLSCKRLGNEPCERCVRLKAECKSSPSLRFRKPSNGSNNGTKQSNLRQSSTSQLDQQSQKRSNSGIAHMPVHTEAGIPYPGPYSFNGMAEHLWPAHNVDAGLLIYHSDGNQIYQALPPQQIGFQMDQNKLLRHNFVTSPVEEIVDSSNIFHTPPTSSALPLMNGLSSSWAASNVSHGPCGTDLVGPNDFDYEWKSGVEAAAATKAILETPFLSQMSHNGGYIGNILHGGSSQCDLSHPSSKASRHKQHATHRGPLRTVPKSLISELCDMSAQLWDMSNTITITRNDSNSVLEGVTFPQSSSQSMASSGITTGTHDSTQGNTHSGGQSPAGSTHDLYFPMDALFAVSRNFIQTIQIACHGQKDDSGPTLGNGVGTTNMEGASNDRVDAESFIVLADSTYAALLDVYQRVFHLVEVTANNERPTSSSHNGNNNGSNHFMRASKGDLKHPARFASGPSSSWKDSAALSCLRVCRFPDVSVGGFPIVSTPALQLGLGLRLADDFLSHFSSVVVTMHNCFSPARRGENVAVSAPAEQQQQQQQHPLPTVSTNCLPHPPLVISEDLFAIDGFGAPMDWDASTATSVSSSSGTSSLFSLQYGLGMHRSPSSMDDIVLREHDLRQELAGLRNKLAV